MSLVFTAVVKIAFSDQVKKLSALGFHPDDCVAALAQCNGHLDDAALWLTHHADLADTVVRAKDYVDTNDSILSFHTIEVHKHCVDSDGRLISVVVAV
jgi:hypothetical protein